MGQWEAVDIVPLREGESAWRVYEGRSLSLGQGAGAIEPAALDPRTGWVDRFRPSTSRHPWLEPEAPH